MEIQIELFEMGGREYFLYSNTSSQAVELPLEIGPDGGALERIDEDLMLEFDTYGGVLPARFRGAGAPRCPWISVGRSGLTH